jgi:hypothetical protein
MLPQNNVTSGEYFPNFIGDSHFVHDSSGDWAHHHVVELYGGVPWETRELGQGILL